MPVTSSQLAFVFPGQGSQAVGMGRNLAANHTAAADLFRRAEAASGLPLADLCFNGPEYALKDTANAQPALLTVGLAALAAWRAGGGPDAGFMAGHSLGEYAALVAAGVLQVEIGVQLVKRRGTLMAEAARERGGAMAAVLGLDSDTLDRLCAEDPGVVVVANFNSPGQVVLSGETDAVERVSAAAKSAGAKRVTPLAVSGAFHSPLMKAASDGLREALASAPFHPSPTPVYANVTAQPVPNVEEWRHLLPQQVVSRVRWEETVRNMVAHGARVFIEMGPGKVLSGLIRRIEPGVTVFNVEDTASLEKTLAELIAWDG